MTSIVKTWHWQVSDVAEFQKTSWSENQFEFAHLTQGTICRTLR